MKLKYEFLLFKQSFQDLNKKFYKLKYPVSKLKISLKPINHFHAHSKEKQQRKKKQRQSENKYSPISLKTI